MEGNLDCGRAGEAIAAQYLRLKGYRIIERNCRAGRGEIDIIALDGNCLVFVEVKTRRGDRFGGAAQAVDRRKILSMRRTAARVLSSGRCPRRAEEHRLDVVTLDLDPGGGGMRLRHLRGVI